MTPGRTVVVTGAAGFLGSHVVELLSAAGYHDVIATDVGGSPRAAVLAALPGVRFHAADLRDAAAVEPLLRGCDAVVHLAAVRAQAAAASPRQAYDVNVGATVDLVSLAIRHGVRRIVHGSSHLVYGSFQDPGAVPFREDQAVVSPGIGAYAASKLAAEAFIAASCGEGGPDYLALRLGTLYGPRANPDSTSGTLLEVLGALDRGEVAAVPWTRDTVHALTYVGDAARAVVRALDVPCARVAVNVVGDPVTAEELYTTLVKLSGGSQDEIAWGDERRRYQFVNADRMRTVLGIDSTTDLGSGLSALIDWHRNGSAR